MGETNRLLKEQHENLDLQEKGGQVLREFTRVVNTFNTALKCKEKQRLTLIGKIDELRELIGENFQKLKTITRNIEIYNQNTQKIAATLENFNQREKLIKGQFELLLQGSQTNEENPRAPKEASTSVTRKP